MCNRPGLKAICRIFKVNKDKAKAMKVKWHNDRYNCNYHMAIYSVWSFNRKYKISQFTKKIATYVHRVI